MKTNRALQLLVMLKSLVVCSPLGLKIVPASLNATVGSTVEFSCGTIDSTLNILWFYDIPATESTYQLPGGGFVKNLRLNAQVEHNGSRFDCYLLNGTVQIEYTEVILLIQGQSAYFTFIILLYTSTSGPLASIGNLSIIEQQPCSVTLSWKSPYSLEGVPILGYNVSIESALMTENEIVNVTSYKFIPSILNDTYQVIVSGINDAGLGNSSVMSVSFSHGNVIKILCNVIFILIISSNQ